MVRPYTDPETGEQNYIVLIHPKQLDSWVKMVVRAKSYWDRHVERHNRRAARLSLEPIDDSYSRELADEIAQLTRK